jgi:hypothetical protein
MSVVDHSVNDIPISHVLSDEKEGYSAVAGLSSSWTKTFCINSMRNADYLLGAYPFFEVRNLILG